MIWKRLLLKFEAIMQIKSQNSRPDGYFLEAEEESVKLVWERKKKVRTERKERKEVPKIELKDLKIKELTKKDFASIIALEREIYETELVRGQAMINDLEEGKGLKYSVIIFGKRPGKKEDESLGYIVAYEDETDEGEPCVYLDDIALAPDCRGLGLGWQLLQKTIERIKFEAKKRGKPILFDMHLREDSQRLFERHKEDMERMGVHLVESVLVPDHYGEGEDALYCVYEVKGE